MAEFASKGAAGTALGFGIAGTALALMNNGGCGNNGFLGGLFGNRSCCSDDQFVTRYEAKQADVIAAKDSEIALLKSNTYTDSKIIDVFERLNIRLTSLEKNTAVNTQSINDNLAFLSSKIDCETAKLKCYVDSTFVPGKLVMPLDAICPPAMPASTTASTTAAK